MNTPIRRSLAVATALVAAAGLAACSGDDNGPSPALSATPPIATPTNPALAGLVGPGCTDYVTKVPKGAGSVAGMANATLASAAAKNPQLTMLTKAISGKLNPSVKLVDTLNGGEYTVFAPVDAAFAKLPAADTATLKADRVQLIRLLTYHVVAGQLDAKQVVGKQKSVQGGDLAVTGSGTALKVNGANVICGGFRTANAVVYLIDTVLTPPK
jgi:uncharacterized surface protein with fasciclin (FAS1) repeats